MFRRIEVMDSMSAEAFENMRKMMESPKDIEKEELLRFRKSGLDGGPGFDVREAWHDMPPPPRRLSKNVRFYFTEKGWNIYGRRTIKLCQRVGQQYRVIRIKEKSVDVVFRDEFQVAVRPRKRKAARRHVQIDID